MRKTKSKRVKNSSKPAIFSINFWLIFFVCLLCLIGLVFIYSASKYSSDILYNDSFYFVKKQIKVNKWLTFINHDVIINT